MSDTLRGVRVIDLTRMLAGPYGSMILADMGADVIKVEEPDGGDPIRHTGPPFIDGESAYFLAVNRNKRSVCLDLTTSEGRSLFHRLVETADVVFDNFRPGVTERLGIDPAACRETKPDIITCSITAFGSDGPYADVPAFDLTLQAMGGGISLTGERGRAPVRMGLPIGDLAGGMTAVGAITSALFRRERTGQGQHIDLSLLDVQVSLLTYVAQYHFADGLVPPPTGSAHSVVVPYQVFPTADGHVAIAVFTDRFWPRFCHAIGLLDLSDRYASLAQRQAARDHLVGVISDRLRDETTDHWVARLWRASVPSGPVNTIDRVLTDRQVRHRGMVAELTRPHPTAGSFPVLGNPVKVGQADRFEPAPLLGEHTEEVLGSLPGIDGDELSRLAVAGVINEPSPSEPLGSR